MHKLRVGIAGCGKVAHLHAKALSSLPSATLAGVQSRSLDKANTFGAQYKAKGYDDISEMVTMENLDVVIVCTPHPNHLETTMKAMESGAHVLIEKPLAATLSDCDTMINASKIHERKLGVISQRRFYEPVKRVKRAIVDGKIGKPVLATVQMFGWRDEAYYASDPWRGSWAHEGGGVLVNQAPHQLDVLLWFMGEIDELYGAWANLNHPYVEVEDTAMALIRFKSGALGNLVVSNSQKPGMYGKIHVHGSNGASVGVQPEGGSSFIAGMTSIAAPPTNDLWTVPGEESMLSEWVKADTDFFSSVDPTVYYIQRQIEDFIEAIHTGRDPLVTAEDGRRTVELFTAIYRSQRDNQVIKFPLSPETDRKDFDGRLTS